MGGDGIGWGRDWMGQDWMGRESTQKYKKVTYFYAKMQTVIYFYAKIQKRNIFLRKNVDLQLQQQRCDHHVTSSYDIII